MGKSMNTASSAALVHGQREKGREERVRRMTEGRDEGRRREMKRDGER